MNASALPVAADDMAGEEVSSPLPTASTDAEVFPEVAVPVAPVSAEVETEVAEAQDEPAETKADAVADATEAVSSVEEPKAEVDLSNDAFDDLHPGSLTLPAVVGEATDPFGELGQAAGRLQLID